MDYFGFQFFSILSDSFPLFTSLYIYIYMCVCVCVCVRESVCQCLCVSVYLSSMEWLGLYIIIVKKVFDLFQQYNC